MATSAQINANQSNAAQSTGPQTAAGKAASARNATRHGFRSQSVLLPGDDPAAYQALLDELTQHHQPVALTQQRAVREMADAEWRLRRVRQYLESMLAQQMGEIEQTNPIQAQVLAYTTLIETSQTFAQFLKFEAKYERQYDRAQRALTAARRDAHQLRAAELRNAMQEIEFLAKPQNATNEPNSTPRNAPCPCGSQEKYKRCCGKDAPPVLNAPGPRHQSAGGVNKAA